MSDARTIAPLSIRYRTRGRTYHIGLRVRTPEGMATVTAFDPGEAYDIGVTLDSTGVQVYTTWEYADPVPEERTAMNDDALWADDAELARLRTDLAGASAALSQARREVAAEWRAREIAEARLYAYGDHQSHCPLWHGGRGECTCGYAMMSQTPPLLTELDAARAALAHAQQATADERAARQACDVLLDAIEMATTDDAVRTAIRRAREER